MFLNGIQEGYDGAGGMFSCAEDMVSKVIRSQYQRVLNDLLIYAGNLDGVLHQQLSRLPG